MTKGRQRLALLAIVAAAAAVRLPLLVSGLPYLGYVDEGHVLHPVQHLVRAGGWDPGWYGYPSLTIYAIAGAVHAVRPAYRLVHGHSLLLDLPEKEDYYDAISPPELVLAGRVVVVLASLLTVALGMSLARRLGGDRAAVASGLLLAFCPALVQRSPIVIVDTVAALFTTAAFLAAEALRAAVLDTGPDGARARRLALAAGALSGLAAAAKYPSALVFAAVALAAFAGRARPLESLRLTALAGAGAAAAAFAAMPALVTRTRQVADSLAAQSRFYSIPFGPSLLRQALSPWEMGPSLLVAGTIGVVALLSRRATRGAALGWVTFGALLVTPLALYKMQPFRNVLPVVVVLLVGAGCLVGDGAPLARRPVASIALVGVLLASIVPGLSVVFRERMARDSRVSLVDVLAGPEWKGRRALVQRELAILPSELARAACDTEVAPWEALPALAASGRFDLVVFGRFEDEKPLLPDWVERARPFEARAVALPRVATFGSMRTSVNPGFWRSNDELVIAARLEAWAP